MESTRKISIASALVTVALGTPLVAWLAVAPVLTPTLTTRDSGTVSQHHANSGGADAGTRPVTPSAAATTPAAVRPAPTPSQTTTRAARVAVVADPTTDPPAPSDQPTSGAPTAPPANGPPAPPVTTAACDPNGPDAVHCP
jgi:hypothetical protein